MRCGNVIPEKKKAPSSRFKDGAPFRTYGCLVRAGTAAGCWAGLFVRDYRGRLGRHGNREDVLLGFDLAEEVLVSDVLEPQGRFVFGSGADFARKEERARAIFDAGDDEFREVTLIQAMNAVVAGGERFPSDYEFIGNVYDDLINFLGPGGKGQRSEPKKCRQESSVPFHCFSFLSFGALLAGSRLPLRIARKASTSNLRTIIQNVDILLDASAICAL
jgi:hypothetical protein